MEPNALTVVASKSSKFWVDFAHYSRCTFSYFIVSRKTGQTGAGDDRLSFSAGLCGGGTPLGTCLKVPQLETLRKGFAFVAVSSK